MLGQRGHGGDFTIQHAPVEEREVVGARARLGDVEPLIDAIDDGRVLDWEAWKCSVELAAARLFEGGGRADVQLVVGTAPRRIDDSERTLSVSGDLGSGTNVVLSIERPGAGRLLASERFRMRRVAYHLENSACFHAGRRSSPLSAAVASPMLWLDLVHGRASLIRDGDSYRVLSAPPSWVRHRAFTSTQAQVVTLAIRGKLYKSIAIDLGISSAAVSHAIAIAAAKIGVRKPVELLRLAHGLAVREGDATGEACLTDAERQVLELVVTGMSNDAIARERSRSLRTVANQVSSVLRKLRCASRYQLVASRCAPVPG